MTRSERDLVTALRDELAAIDPSRPCDRVAEAAGLGPRIGRPRDRRSPGWPCVCGGRGRGAQAAPFDWATAADHCRAAWLRGRFLARGSLSLAGGRTHLEFVVAPDEAPTLAARLGRVRAARLVADPPRPRRGDLEERRGGRHVPAAASGRRAPCSSSRRARSRGPCAASSTACSTPNRRTSSAPSAPPAGSSTRSPSSTPTAGCRQQPYLVRLVADARRETPEASLAELAERLELHRSAVQRALERLERLAEARDRAPPAHVDARPLWHDSPMRDVIVAANWKMHTTPADAGELARTIAARTREAGVTRVICPPFVCLAAVRDALAETRPRRRGSAPRTSITSWPGAYTGEVSAPMLAGLATWVIVGHSERRRDAGETDELIGRKLGRAVDAGLRPILCVGEQLADREAGRPGRRRAAGSCAGALARARPGARSPAAGLVIAYEPVWAIGTGRNASGADAAAMADAIRDTPRRARFGATTGEAIAGPVRRQRHLRQHRRVPGRALDRRRARRRRLAQARRDGRDRRPAGHDGRGPRRWPADRRVTDLRHRAADPAAADRPRRPRRVRDRRRPGR